VLSLAPVPGKDRLRVATLDVGGGAAAAVTVVTNAPNVAAGDPPEYVSGVKELGVLHAPGYPSYVLLTRGFSELVPIGSLTFRVLLFSLVCAVIAVAA
jgi:hypothetical protein